MLVAASHPPLRKQQAGGWSSFPGPAHMAGVGPLLDSQLHPAPS